MRLMNFQISEELHNELKIMAARESRKMGEIITEQVEAYIKIHKEGNPQHLITTYVMRMGFASVSVEKIKIP